MSSTLVSASDRELVGAFRAGDPAAFAALYDRYRSPTFAYLRRRCGSKRGAAVFIDVWREIAEEVEPSPDAEFAAQLFGIAHSLARLRAAGSSSDLRLGDPTAPPREFTMRTRHRAQSFDRALRGVDTVDRDAYLLYEEGGLTLDEVGGIIGTGAEVARGHVRRTLRALQDALGSAPQNRLELHDPQIAVAHLAARLGPEPALDATVLDHAERIAAEHARDGGTRRSVRRRYLRLSVVAAAVALLVLFALQSVDQQDERSTPQRAASEPLGEPVGDPVVPVPTTASQTPPPPSRT